ncbi:hypothetical protein P5V15_011733 [Pogonomyrmex californicus]
MGSDEDTIDMNQNVSYEYCEEDMDTILIDLVKIPDCQSGWQRLQEKFSREKKRELESRSGSEASTRSTPCTNFGSKGTHYFTVKIMPKNTCISEKYLMHTVASTNKSLLPSLSIHHSSSLSSPSLVSILSSSLSSTLSTNEKDISLINLFLSLAPIPSLSQSSSLLLSSTLSSNNNKISTQSIKPSTKVILQKENKYRNEIIEETNEIEKSFINLSSIVTQYLLEKQKMDEDDFFSHTVAYQLRKIEELRKSELKGKIMKILYEL